MCFVTKLKNMNNYFSPHFYIPNNNYFFFLLMEYAFRKLNGSLVDSSRQILYMQSHTQTGVIPLYNNISFRLLNQSNVFGLMETLTCFLF